MISRNDVFRGPEGPRREATLCLVREAILQYNVIQKYKSVYQYIDEEIKWTRPEKQRN